MNRSTFLIVTVAILVAQISFAEVIFYRPSVKIADVNCEDQTVTLANMFRTRMKLRQPVKEAYQGFCEKISVFAENSSRGTTSGNAGKRVTLLTVEAKSIGDSIYEEEVVGVLDVDYINSAFSVVGHDLVQTRLCGLLNTGTRSNPEICLYESNEGKYFIESKSVQAGRFEKTMIVSSSNSSIVLESKDSQGKITTRFSGTWNADKSAMNAKINFGNGERDVLLNSK